MKKKSLAFLIGIALILVAVGVVLASPGNKYGKAVTPPFPQPAEKDLRKIIFIRYTPGFQKDKPCDYDGVCDPDEKRWCADCRKGEGEPKETVCYDFLAGSKPRWTWVEDYKYSDGSLAGPSFSAVTAWENPVLDEIFGEGDLETPYTWGDYDSVNSISYGDYDDTGMCPTPDPCVIAVTAIWFRGKNIYEYDIMFDTNYFSGDGSVDLDTVVLHEFGHGAGLNDLYDVVCEGEVMHGYYHGVKTTLGDGDIAGIQTLYGAD